MENQTAALDASKLVGALEGVSFYSSRDVLMRKIVYFKEEELHKVLDLLFFDARCFADEEEAVGFVVPPNITTSTTDHQDDCKKKKKKKKKEDKDKQHSNGVDLAHGLIEHLISERCLWEARRDFVVLHSTTGQRLLCLVTPSKLFSPPLFRANQVAPDKEAAIWSFVYMNPAEVVFEKFKLLRSVDRFLQKIYNNKKGE